MQKFYTRWENTNADEFEDRIMSIISFKTHVEIAQLRKSSHRTQRSWHSSNRWHFRPVAPDDKTITEVFGDNWKYETDSGFATVKAFTEWNRRKECL
tara:strand:- start:2601 stop:2891 length:291 start_codon:yes stop_codon:yes gene_type:complete